MVNTTFEGCTLADPYDLGATPDLKIAHRMAITISKSRFLAGCQCLKRLYLQVQQPELVAQPDGSGEAIINQGREVGLLARELFPGGVEVDGSTGFGQAIPHHERTDDANFVLLGIGSVIQPSGNFPVKFYASSHIRSIDRYATSFQIGRPKL